MESSSIVSQVYKARTTLLQQFGDQGFVISNLVESNLVGFTVAEVALMLKHSQLDFTVSKPDGETTYVKFHIEKALRPPVLLELVDELFNVTERMKKTDTLYIVTNADPNETLVRTMSNIWQKSGIFVCINSLQRLQFNALGHSLVPKHIKLTTEEADAIKQKYSIKRDSQLPQISRFDPIAIILGLRPGQMCHIQRPSRTAIIADSYRICED